MPSTYDVFKLLHKSLPETLRQQGYEYAGLDIKHPNTKTSQVNYKLKFVRGSKELIITISGEED